MRTETEIQNKILELRTEFFNENVDYSLRVVDGCVKTLKWVLGNEWTNPIPRNPRHLISKNETTNDDNENGDEKNANQN